jgi:hypothetical protein
MQTDRPCLLLRRRGLCRMLADLPGDGTEKRRQVVRRILTIDSQLSTITPAIASEIAWDGYFVLESQICRS